MTTTPTRRRERECPELAQSITRIGKSLTRRAADEGDLEAIEALRDSIAALNVELTNAVRAAHDRTDPVNGSHYSWDDLADVLGMTRQAAFKRFARH